MSTLHHFLNNVLKYERPPVDRRLLWGAWQPPHTPCPLSLRSAGAPPFGRRSLIPPARRGSLAIALRVGRCGGLPPCPPPLTSITRRRRLRGSRSAPPDPPVLFTCRATRVTHPPPIKEKRDTALYPDHLSGAANVAPPLKPRATPFHYEQCPCARSLPPLANPIMQGNTNHPACHDY